MRTIKRGILGDRSPQRSIWRYGS